MKFMAKRKTKKQPVKKEDKYTDILEERYDVDGQEVCKKTYMNGKKKVKEEVVNE